MYGGINIKKKKILFALIILLIAISSMSAVSASWFFDGGKDIAVNGLNFHIPEGFEEDTSKHEITDKSETVEYKNGYQILHISVRTFDNPDITSAKQMDWGKHAGAMVEKSISGKDGIVSYEFRGLAGYYYVEEGRLVTIVCPFILDDGTRYDNFLSEVIK